MSTPENKPCAIPDVSDWKVIDGGDNVWVESETIAYTLPDYDDAWLKVTGNMSREEKLAYAEHVAAKLNRRAASEAPAEPVAPTDVETAAEAFHEEMKPRANFSDGGVRLWTGWALIEAFKAGAASVQPSKAPIPEQEKK